MISTIFFSIILGLTLGLPVGYFQYLQLQEAQATGGAGEIKGLIDPMIERAIQALQEGNTELALEEIETLKNELDDTFSTDESEED